MKQLQGRYLKIPCNLMNTRHAEQLVKYHGSGQTEKKPCREVIEFHQWLALVCKVLVVLIICNLFSFSFFKWALWCVS